jgi:hypothetical protein
VIVKHSRGKLDCQFFFSDRTFFPRRYPEPVCPEPTTRVDPIQEKPGFFLAGNEFWCTKAHYYPEFARQFGASEWKKQQLLPDVTLLTTPLKTAGTRI